MTLILAIPSKGRLQEQTLAWLADAGLSMVQSRGARDYTANLAGIDGVTLSLLSAADIAAELIAGHVHLGITGEDLLAENGAGHRVHSVERLGFGRANVIVAVPRAWIDVWTMADLDDVAASFHTRHHRKLRVATKYLTLARDFFLSHGIADYRIVESLGATEGAPAAGTAEVIVDITTTGATLSANDLKTLDDGIILESQAALTASLRASWTPSARTAARALLDRIAARTTARSSQLIVIERNPATEPAITALIRDFGASRLPGPDTAQASLIVPETNLQPAISRLRELKPDITFTTQKPAQIFTRENGLYERLEAKLAG